MGVYMLTYKIIKIQQGLLELRYYLNGKYQDFKICESSRLKDFLKALNIPEENLISEGLK